MQTYLNIENSEKIIGGDIMAYEFGFILPYLVLGFIIYIIGSGRK